MKCQFAEIKGFSTLFPYDARLQSLLVMEFTDLSFYALSFKCTHACLFLFNLNYFIIIFI